MSPRRFFGMVSVAAACAACDGSDAVAATEGDATVSEASVDAAPDAPLGDAEAGAHPTTQAVIAHRGASGHAPEHTLAAYELAVELGADYLEQDVGMTKDGVLVCLHDATLDRTARGDAASCSGALRDKTLAQIKTCDVGSWFNEANPELARPEYAGLSIPTLAEVFERFGTEASYYIETKTLGGSTPMEPELYRLIDEHGLREAAVLHRGVVIQSFDATSLQRMRDTDAELPLVQLLLVAPDDAALDALDPLFGIAPPAATTTEDLIGKAHARQLAVHAYTVNDAAELEQLAARCVDGMFTNFPDRYRSVLEATKLPCPAAIR